MVARVLEQPRGRPSRPSTPTASTPPPPATERGDRRARPTRSRTSSSPTTRSSRPSCAAGTPDPDVVLEGAAQLDRGALAVLPRRPRGQPSWTPRHTSRHAGRPSTSCGACVTATHARPAQLGCFGLHEWAMVYRQSPDEVRHAAWPLRLGAHRHRRGRRRAADPVHALRRLPLLHSPGPVAEPPAADPRRPGRPRAAGLPPRRHGPLQVVHEARARRAQRR